MADSTMNKKQKLIEKLKWKIEADGFAHAISQDSLDLAENCEEFLQLRRDYMEAVNKLEKYLGLNN